MPGRILIRLCLGLAMLVATRGPSDAADTSWVAATAHDGVAYFLRDQPPQVARYDMESGQWLAPIPVSPGGTALAVGAQGIFVGFGRRIARIDPGGEAHLTNTAGDVQELVLANTLIAALEYGNGLLSIDPATGATLGVQTAFYAYYGLTGLSVAPGRQLLFGASSGLSPADIIVEALLPNGTFGTEEDSPYHGDYPIGSRTFVFPGEGRVATDGGPVYTTARRLHAGDLGGGFDDLAFYADLPIVLRGRTLFAYDRALRETDHHDLPESAARAAAGQAAILHGYRSPLLGHYVWIHTVDGVVIEPTGFKQAEIEIAAGPHSVGVGYIDGYERSLEDAVIQFDAQPNRRYEVHASGVREGVLSEFGQAFVGGQGKWVAWIEDEATGALVAGRRATGLFTTTLESPPPPTPPDESGH